MGGMKRIFGWTLIVVGTLMFVRTYWLGAMYFKSMSPISQARYYVAVPVSPVIVAAGICILRRRHRL
jgi:hypothetical protein